MLLLALGVALGAPQDTAWNKTYRYLPPLSETARQYVLWRYGLLVASILWTLTGLTLALWWRLARRVGDRLSHAHPWLTAGGVWAAQATFVGLWMLPVSVAYVAVERCFGFSTLSFWTWSSDRLLEWLLSVLWAPLIVIGLVIVRKYPRSWWFRVGVLLLPVSFALTIIYPEVIDPLFNKFEPLRNAALRNEIRTLSKRGGLGSPDIFVVDASRRTRKANAYVTGLGPTHRVVLWDTLLETRDHEEVSAIVAHELGHYALAHIWWGFLLQALGGFAILGLMAVVLNRVVTRWGPILGIVATHDPSVVSLAHLVLYVLLLLQTPAASAISRHMERQADAYALRVYPRPEAVARSLAAFAAREYSDPDPPRWVVWLFASHPPLRERVAAALRYADTRTEENGLTHGSQRTGRPRAAERSAAEVN